MIWEIHLGIFDTFTKVRTCGQHPGIMSRVGWSGSFLVFSFLHVSEHSGHILYQDFFCEEKLNNCTDWAYSSPPLQTFLPKSLLGF